MIMPVILLTSNGSTWHKGGSLHPASSINDCTEQSLRKSQPTHLLDNLRQQFNTLLGIDFIAVAGVGVLQ